YYADRAAAAQARLSAGAGVATAPASLKVKAATATAQGLIRPDRVTQGADFDAEVIAVDAAGLVTSAATPMNGLMGPPWLKAGWFQALRLLGESIDDSAQKQRIDDDVRRLMAGDVADLTERIGLERELVGRLTAGCGAMVAGYTVKRE